MKICLKWVHMARYELILRLDGALWHTIISGPLLTKKCPIQIQKCPQHPKSQKNALCWPLLLSTRGGGIGIFDQNPQIAKILPLMHLS